ncbi:MAG: hypothetical protein ACKOUT_07290 [Novosphingobium sp.]
MALTLGANPALAACSATVSSAPATLNYDPIKAVAATTTTFTVSISKGASSDDAFRLIFTDSATGSPLKVGTSGPQYAITDTIGQTVSFQSGTTAAGQSGLNTIVLASGNGTTSATYTVSLPVNSTTDFVGGNNFIENLGYSLQCLKNNVVQSTGSGSLTSLNASITNVLSVVTASPQTLNFGNFTSASQTLQVGLKSTNSINVSVSSLNSSTMVLAGATPPYNSSNSIPYTMTFNGATLSSSGTNNVARASVTGSTYPFVMSLTGGVPSGKFSGVYADVITLTFTPGI